MKFKIDEMRERNAQKFDKEEIFIEKAGKKINVYDQIQAGREDTEIYPTLEKYGCIDRLQMNVKEVYGELLQINDLKNVFEQKKQAEQLWYNLPIDVRNKFNNKQSEFGEKGLEYLKSEIQKIEETNKTPIKTPIEEKSQITTKGMTNE